MRTVSADVHQDSAISYEFISQEELKKIYANDQIQMGEKSIGNSTTPIMKNKITAWGEHKDCRTYRGVVVFAPGKKLPWDYYNSWEGFAIEPSILGAVTIADFKNAETIKL